MDTCFWCDTSHPVRCYDSYAGGGPIDGIREVLPGAEELINTLEHRSGVQFQTDADVDVHSDGIEVARDGNPNNRSVMPTGALAVFPAVDVEFYTLNSVKYQLEVSTDMVSWTAQGGVVVGNGGSQNHLVRANKATQFWRLKVVQ